MKFKGLFPTESYELTTDLPVTEVLTRLYNAIDPRKTLSMLASKSTFKKPYEGIVYVDGFKINQKIVGKQNSFAPVMTGKVSTRLNQTTIDVELTLQPFTKVFMALWVGFLGVFCTVMLYKAFISPSKSFLNNFSVSSLAPFGMLIFGFGLTLFGFKTESQNAKDYLRNLLEGDEANLMTPFK